MPYRGRAVTSGRQYPAYVWTYSGEGLKIHKWDIHDLRDAANKLLEIVNPASEANRDLTPDELQLVGALGRRIHHYENAARKRKAAR